MCIEGGFHTYYSILTFRVVGVATTTPLLAAAFSRLRRIEWVMVVERSKSRVYMRFTMMAAKVSLIRVLGGGQYCVIEGERVLCT
jgi:hypothetical protein